MFRFVWPLALIPSLAGPPATSPVRADTTLLASATMGQAIVRAAVEAVGGQRTLASLKGLEFWLEGNSFNPVQGFSPAAVDHPERDGLFRSHTTLDLAGGRSYQEQRQDLPGGFDFHFATLVVPGKQFNLGYRDRTLTIQPVTATSQAAPLVDATARYFPALLLRQAAQVINSARWIGATTTRGRVADLVDYSWDERTRHRLSVDRETRAVLHLQIVTVDPLGPLIEATYDYRGGRKIGSLVVPDSVRLTRRGMVALDLQIRDVRFDAQIDTTRFIPPTDLNEVPLAVTPATTQPVPGVYQIAGLGGGAYRSFFVPLDSGVVLFDPVLGNPVGNLLLGEVRKAVGDRPVKVVVVSHFHADHAGGIGAFLAGGATIYVPRGSEAVISRYAAASTGVAPATFASRVVPIEPGGSVTLDPKRQLVVTNLGKTPHVDGILMMRDGVSRTVINADMYSPLSPFNETFAGFVDWLGKQSAKTELVIGTHHTPIRLDSLVVLRKRFTKPAGN